MIKFNDYVLTRDNEGYYSLWDINEKLNLFQRGGYWVSYTASPIADDKDNNLSNVNSVTNKHISIKKGGIQTLRVSTDIKITKI